MHAVTFFTVFILYFKNVNGKQPNIVFILADDYGYNDIGYHGSQIKTPTLDKLAAEGIKLENYYVQPICTPTRSQLMSGRYQIHTGLQHDIIWPPQPNCLPLSDPTIADKLKEQGYATHIIGKWHLGFYKKECTPTYRGFDTFFGFLGGSEDYYNHNWGPGYDLHIANSTHSKVDWADKGPYSAHLFASRAQHIVENHAETAQDKPLFLYLPMQAVHSPLEVPKHYKDQYSYIRNNARRTYAGMVSSMDDIVKNVTDTLKSTGLWEDTLLIFSTDNGGQVLSGGNNWPLRGWKGSLWEGGMRGVGFVTGPLLQSQRGRVSRQLIHVSDWFPTLLHLAGGSSAGLKLDGFNQWNTLSKNEASPRTELLHNIDPLFVTAGQTLYNNTFDNRIRAAIRRGPWKLITGNPANGSWIPPPAEDDSMSFLPADDSTVELSQSSGVKNLWLFNIEDDPYEQRDLSADRVDIVKQLLDRLLYYNSTAVPVSYPPNDPKSNPKYHGGAWLPWVQ